MARGHRRDDLLITLSCAQPGTRRFSNGDTPIVANGRNNLTALSSELDLYFVAELNEIRVYKPWFPIQFLSDLLYKWTLPTSAPGLHGYLDRRHPHAVNSIIIDKLGLQEVLICACDDGDVLLYYTKPLEKLLKELQTGANPESWFTPLVIQNVGKSAWGLAVHRNARMLGVSSNTHDITVFAFGLTDDSVLYNDPEIEWQYPGRSKDTSLTLRAHHTNIPNIAFFNSDRDKEGRYLVSTDLTGLVILWDLRERNRLKQILPRASSIHPNPHSGWSVACLDPSWFLLTKDDAEFLGCKSEQDAHGTYDITQARLRVKDSSTSYQAASQLSPTTTDDSILERIRRRVAEIREDMLNRLQGHEENSEITNRENPQSTIAADTDATDIDPSELSPSVDTDVEEADPIDEEDEDMQSMDLTVDTFFGTDLDGQPETSSGENQIFQGFEWASNAVVETSPPPFLGFSDMELSEERVEGLAYDRFGSPTERTPTTGSVPRGVPLPPALEQDTMNHMRSNVSQHSIITKSLARTIASGAPFVLLHAGADFVSLQKEPFRDLAVLSRDPCYQLLPPIMTWLLHYDRLNLTQIIPELNTIIAATPTGRAAIYTMTRRIAKGRSRSRIQDDYSLRLDHIVPFSSQERRGERPKLLLIGIAAAPVQGHELKGQRWRLLLTYSDHTVLSYELWRESPLASSFI